MNKEIDYILHLADNAVVMGQRNAQWCGVAPIIEEDMALANISLDLIGQARLLYQLAARMMGGDTTEDRLAYFRNEQEYLNYTLVEIPHRHIISSYAGSDNDYGVCITANFFFSSLMALVWDKLQTSTNADLAAIAAKSLKETTYHVRHSRDWLIRLGDGTEQSHQRVQAAVDMLYPYTHEFWLESEVEKAVKESGLGTDMAALRGKWDSFVNESLQEATLTRPQDVKGYITEGKKGLHSEHLGYLLTEMQSLARAHPDATW